MKDVEEPELSGRTNKDLMAWALNLRTSVRKANANFKALRAWADGTDEDIPRSDN